MAIIGVIAAITLPMIVSSYEAKIRETQLKKVYSILARTHQMMVVHDILPYEEFVMIDSSSNDTSGGNSGDSASADDSDSAENPETPSTTDPEVTPDSGSNTDPDDDDDDGKKSRSTKDLIDGIINKLNENIDKHLPVIGLAGAINDTINDKDVQDAYNELLDKYGTGNWEKCGEDYAADSGKELNSNMRSVLHGLDVLHSLIHGNSSSSSYRYLNIYADTAETTTNDSQQEKFLAKKKYQLQVLKEQLNGADYCTRYYLCSGQEITYTNLNGDAASIEAADFENSALRTEDGMYIWLGDINNSQRYYVDINGQKRPNRLGVDVFTFDIIPQEMVIPEINGNCTKTGTPTDGETYRGLGCTGYALTDSNPDENQRGYWKRY